MKKVIALAVIAFFIVNKGTKVYAYEKADLVDYTNYIGGQYGIAPELIQAIIEVESSWNPAAKNGTCIGLMQINENAHMDRMKRIAEEFDWDLDLENPYFNIQVGCDYLAELFDKYDDVGLVLMKYHGEKNAVNKAKSGKLSRYARKILKISERLEEANGKFWSN